MSLVKEAHPFGIGVFLHLIYFQSAILILGKISGTAYAGLFSVAFTIVTLAYLLPGVIFQKYLLPKVHQLTAKGEVDRLFTIFGQGFRLMLMSGLSLAIVFYFFADVLILTIFGQEYTDAIIVLKGLSFCIFLRYLSSSAGVFLVSGELIKKKNQYMLLCALFSVTSNVLLVPFYGIKAAVFTTLLSEIMLLSMFFYGVFHHKFNQFSMLQLFLRR
jgi:O-antigen/teichoic acid export membrane protein